MAREMLAALAAAATVFAAPAVLAQSASDDASVIAVTGRGEASRAADFYVFEGVVWGEGADRVAALAALKAKQERVFAGLFALEGGERIGIETGKLEVGAAYPPNCDEDRHQRSGQCAPTGYGARLEVTVTVRPPAMTGRAGSLAAELGMDEVRLKDGGLDNSSSLTAEANRRAYEDARRQAEALASAASARLGRLVRLQDGRVRYGSVDGFLSDAEGLVVTGSRLRPKVDLALRLEPVTETATVTAVFEIER